MYAYHFVGDNLRDGRPVPPDGEWLVHEGEMGICESGLHASRHPMDALNYAPGGTLCLVECEEIGEEHNDKFVCRRRKVVKRIDATDLLRKASREFALSVIRLWDAPQVVRDFLTTGDESLRDAARDAARAAARAAAGGAARGSARAAAWAAARASAWGAAWDAAKAAAGDAARGSAWAAAGGAARAPAWSAQKEIMQRLVDEAFKGEA